MHFSRFEIGSSCKLGLGAFSEHFNGAEVGKTQTFSEHLLCARHRTKC